jgi:hypothetical protein
VIDGILRHVLGQAALDRIGGNGQGPRGAFCILPLFGGGGAQPGRFVREAANQVVRGEETNVSSALEQVPHQDVDGHLGAGFACEHGFPVRLRAEMRDQAGGEGLERFAGAAEVRAVVAKVRQQGKVVPGSLERGQALAVVDHRRHPSQQLFVLLGHGCTATN